MTHLFSVLKTNQFMMYSEITALCSKEPYNIRKCTCVQNVESLKDEWLFFVPDFSCEIFYDGHEF
jgi:hypothetical protein